MTKIEWTGKTWNPIVGCSVVSPGCINCYAMRMAGRLGSNPQVKGKYSGLTDKTKGGPVWNGIVRLDAAALALPLRWRKPRRVFVNSMGDLFHENVPDEWIDRVFAIMALCPQHQFQVLTKRSDRMREYVTETWQPAKAQTFEILDHKIDYPGETKGQTRGGQVWDVADQVACDELLSEGHPSNSYLIGGKRNAPWPLPNVWLGVSIEDRRRGEERAWHLANTPAAVRFWSCEPLLEDLGDLTGLCLRDTIDGDRRAVDWVIVGGESGPGARPMQVDWARSIRDQCLAAGVPFFFKQWGAWLPVDSGHPDLVGPGFGKFDHCEYDQAHECVRVGKKRAGRLLDGRSWEQYPEGGT